MKNLGVDNLTEHDLNFYMGCVEFNKGQINLEDLKQFMPKRSVLTLCHKDHLMFTYLCKDGEMTFDRDLELIQQEGVDFLKKTCHLDTVQHVFPSWFHYLKFGDKYKPFVAMQLVRPNYNVDFIPTRTTVVKSESDQPNLQGLLSMHIPAIDVKDLVNIKKLLSHKLEFVHQNYGKFSRLNHREREILTYLGKGWRGKDIAEKLFISYEYFRKQVKEINVKLELTHTKFNKASIYTMYIYHFGLIDE